jgi:sterol desaturase/sphingolipid hydroxylase (fatty acid hydroxylase superfamily)
MLEEAGNWGLWKAGAAAGGLGLLYALETAWPRFRGRSGRPAHVGRNLLLGVVNAAMTFLLFGAPLLWLTHRANAAELGLLQRLALPPWATWALALLLFDAWMYAWHVLNHRVGFFWRFHRMHHSDGDLDASTALRFHPGEIALSNLARLAVLPLLGMTVMQLALYEALLLPVILFHHSNVAIPRRADAAVRWLVPTPWMHWVHHSDRRVETDSNYGSLLSVWDRLFRSFRLRDDPSRIRLGLDGYHDPARWRTLRAALRTPLD